jgi:hypothetical protein
LFGYEPGRFGPDDVRERSATAADRADERRARTTEGPNPRLILADLGEFSISFARDDDDDGD